MNIDIDDIRADIQTNMSEIAETGSPDAKAILDEMLTIFEPVDFYEEGISIKANPCRNKSIQSWLLKRSWK